MAAIASITILETAAIFAGIDGQLFALAVAVVAGLGGFSLARLRPPPGV